MPYLPISIVERNVHMGLSASQARLLSITSRLSDNELRSQTITTAKMHLANRTTEASAAYMDALSSTNLLFTTYDGEGNKVTEKLTGTSLSQYGPLKNQYGLINNSNQILVSELDATNYENSANMEEFLDKYGVLTPEGEGEFVQVVNPNYEVVWGEYETAYDDWKAKEPQKTDEIYLIPGSDVENSLYQQFLDTTAGCFGLAANSHTCCYMHVLVDLIGPGEHTTSSDPPVTFEVYPDIGTWDWNKTDHTRNEAMEEITKAIHDAKCSGDVIEGGIETVETSYGTVTVGGPPSDPEMSVYQRAVDLLWEVHNEYCLLDPDETSTGGPATQESLQKFFYFVEHDLKQFDVSAPKYDEDAWQEDYEEWLAQEPPVPDEPYYIEEEVRKIVDKDKGQWYINLWHRMNGESDVKAGTVDEEGNVVGGGKTESGLPMYKVLEDGLMNNSEWLQDALNNGTITLERVDFTDPTEEGTGLADCTWTSIIWTSAVDITEEENEAAVAAAEVKYEQALRDIEAKDKQYDNQLKILDTEHNALQTEYDSVKGVIEKTIERNLKLYS